MKILSICGGGVMGIIPAYYLSHVSGIIPKIYNNDVNKNGFDLFAGTSIGSVLSLSLASGKNQKTVYNSLMNCIDDIFSERNFIFQKRPEFNDDILNDKLKFMLDINLVNIKNKVIVPSFDMINFRPKVYDNFSPNNPDCKPAWEVARASVAAPSYFKPWDGMIDGGVYANDPSLIAIGAVISKLGVKLEDIELFSVGCGNYNPGYEKHEIEKYYRWEWLKPALSMVVKANQAATDFTVSQLPLKKYVKFNPVMLKSDWSFVDPSISEKLLDRAGEYRSQFIEEYNNFMNK